ncbi:MAG: hypothetical protein M0004_01895 [Actinomycetota bacterium]|nr:hypothetical protein [Actinomycetota bacterium]
MADEPRFSVRRAQLDLLLGLDQPGAAFARAFVTASFGGPPIAASHATAPAQELAALAMRVYVRATADLDPQEGHRLGVQWLAELRAGRADRLALRSCLVTTAVVARRAGHVEVAIGQLREAMELSRTAPGRRQVALELAIALRRRAGEGDLAEALGLAEALAAERLFDYGDKTNATVLEADHEVLQARLALGEHDVESALDLRARRLWRSGFMSRWTGEAFFIAGRCWLARAHGPAAPGDATIARLIADRYPLDRELSAAVDLLLADTYLALAEGSSEPADQRRLAAEAAGRAAATLAFAYGEAHPQVTAARARAEMLTPSASGGPAAHADGGRGERPSHR